MGLFGVLGQGTLRVRVCSTLTIDRVGSWDVAHLGRPFGWVGPSAVPCRPRLAFHSSWPAGVPASRVARNSLTKSVSLTSFASKAWMGTNAAWMAIRNALATAYLDDIAMVVREDG